MKRHSWIDYEIFGTRHRYTGQWPGDKKAADALGHAFYQLCLSGKKFTEVDTIREAGGTIIEVHSIRPDGSVRSEDLPDWRTD